MNTLLVGLPGSGKTTALCTGRLPIHLIDVDGKAKEMMNIRSLIKKGDVVVKTFKEKLVKDKLRDRALHPDVPPKEMPEGYLAIVDYLNRIIDGDTEFKPFRTIGLDSLTRIGDHHKSLLVHHRGKGKFGKKNIDDDMNWPSWGTYLKNWEELLTPLCTYLEQDFICTVHLKVMVEKEVVVMPGGQAVETKVITGYKSLLDGQIRDKIAGYFNECYYMEAKTSGKNPTYQFRTRGTKYDARTSLPLEEFENANIMELYKKAGLT